MSDELVEMTVHQMDQPKSQRKNKAKSKQNEAFVKEMVVDSVTPNYANPEQKAIDGNETHIRTALINGTENKMKVESTLGTVGNDISKSKGDADFNNRNESIALNSQKVTYIAKDTDFEEGMAWTTPFNQKDADFDNGEHWPLEDPSKTNRHEKKATTEQNMAVAKVKNSTDAASNFVDQEQQLIDTKEVSSYNSSISKPAQGLVKPLSICVEIWNGHGSFTDKIKCTISTNHFVVFVSAIFTVIVYRYCVSRLLKGSRKTAEKSKGDYVPLAIYDEVLEDFDDELESSYESSSEESIGTILSSWSGKKGVMKLKSASLADKEMEEVDR